MDEAILDQFISAYADTFEPMYTGSIGHWVEKNIEFKGRYALPRLDLKLSPYLVQPFEDVKDPNIFIIGLAGTPQTAKTMMSEGSIFWWILNDAGPVMRLHPNEDFADDFAVTRLIPTLKGNPKLAAFIANDRHAAGVKRIRMPHMVINENGPGDDGALIHGITIKYMICDDVHEFKPGILQLAESRTIAFAGKGRKMILTSQPNEANSDYHKYYLRGQIYQWQWCCPECKQYQPWQLSKERPDGSYAGLNCEKILSEKSDATVEVRDIGLSAKTAYLECEHCRHHITDTPTNRTNLNDTGKYVCIKADGNPQIRFYTWPIFVNKSITFAEAMVKYFEAKDKYTTTGDRTDFINFKNQIMGEFYKAEPLADYSKIVISTYDPKSLWPEERFRFMTVDYQRVNWLKYWIVRSHDGKGNSRLLDLGVARTWDEVAEIQKKWNVPTPCVGIDCGYSNKQQDESIEVFAECLKHGEPLKNAKGDWVKWLHWIALRGSGETSFKHPDGMKFYSLLTKGNPNFPLESKYKGLGGCDRYVWANWPVKNVLMNLRDGKYSGVNWTTNMKDREYERHLYSERIVSYLDKRTGMPKERWERIHTDNHYLDCECMNLVLAMMAGAFSVAGLSVDDVIKDVNKIENKQ